MTGTWPYIKIISQICEDSISVKISLSQNFALYGNKNARVPSVTDQSISTNGTYNISAKAVPIDLEED